MEPTMSEVLRRRIILDELEYEPGVDATHIGVAVDEGIVILTGHVASSEEKQVAIIAVRRVNGVLAIADEIEVRDPSEISDDEVAKQVVDILGSDSVIPNRSIRVLVRNGWVTLTGDVDCYIQKQSAGNDIRKLSGVHGIINNIDIKPHVHAMDVRTKIENAVRY
jgi:osmotically-inducible protein OsmY